MKAARNLWAVLLFTLCFLPMAEALAGQSVRLLVKTSAKPVKIEGLDLRSVVAGRRGDRALESSLSLSVRGGSLLLNGVSLGSQSFRVESLATYLWLDGVEFRGPMEFRVQDGQTIQVINHLDLEAYLVGSVASEMPVAWPMEALKAQAIVARSYTLSRLKERAGEVFDLHATVQDQVYHGAERERHRAAVAVKETRGLILQYDGHVVHAYYHAICGGGTEHPPSVWPKAPSFPPRVKCTECLAVPQSQWSHRVTGAEMAKRLAVEGFSSNGVIAVRGLERNPSGRWESVKVIGTHDVKIFPGNTFRRLMGYGAIRSLRFEVRLEQDVFLFEGAGFGHGVGLCQWGAQRMALDGARHAAILARYYPGAILTPMRTSW